MAELQTTGINRGWRIKMFIFLAICLALGCWFLYDAAIAYPARGQEDASYKLRMYLDVCDRAGRLREASVSDPVKTLEALEAREKELQEAAQQVARNEGRGVPLALVDQVIGFARMEWLRAERMAGGLDPAKTTIADPATTLADLNAKWKTTSPPKALSALDIPVQWGIAIICLLCAAYVVLTLMRVSRTHYAYDEAEHRLHLPDGRTLVPADIKEFDKRKWDKFYVFIHPHSGEAPIRLDLLRHTNLEGWVLEMERIAFPEQAAPPAPAPDSAASPAA